MTSRSRRSLLGDAVIGVYLHGSAVLGGLRPTSDLDFLVVVDRELGPSTRAELTRRLLAVSGTRASQPGRPVEITVVARPPATAAVVRSPDSW